MDSVKHMRAAIVGLPEGLEILTEFSFFKACYVPRVESVFFGFKTYLPTLLWKIFQILYSTAYLHSRYQSNKILS